MTARREYYDLHVERDGARKEIRILLRLGLWEQAEIMSAEIYKVFYRKYMPILNKNDYNNMIRYYGTTHNGTLDALPTWAPPFPRK